MIELLLVGLALCFPVMSILGAIAFFKLGRLAQQVRDLEGALRGGVRPARESAVPSVRRPQAAAPDPVSSGRDIWAKPTPQTAAPAEERPAAREVALEDEDTNLLDASAPIEGAPAGTPDPWASPARHGRVGSAISWIAENWLLAVAGLSLALAGLFLVQYGAQRGIFPPVVRILSALGFGAALVYTGERIRRRHGDEEGAIWRDIPSILSGAGLAAMYGAVMGAFHLYDLIGPLQALGGIVAISAGALVLGWFHGQLLTAMGLLGAAAAPFLIGGSSNDLWILQVYFCVLALTGLAVDAVRRWPGRKISWLALAVGIGGTFLILEGDRSSAPAFAVAILAIAAGAMTLPVRQLRPRHTGRMLLEHLVRGKRRPGAETCMAGLAVAAASFGATQLPMHDIRIGAGMILALFFAIAFWGRGARALQDLALLPFAALLAMIASVETGALAVIYPVGSDGDAGTPGSLEILTLLGISAAMSVLAFWRSREGRPSWSVAWSLFAVLATPAAGICAHVMSGAPDIIGGYEWALISLAVAAGMVTMATSWAHDGLDVAVKDDRLRASLAGLMALALTGYAMGYLVGDTALTVAVAFLAFGAARAAARLDLPEMGWFVVLAAPFIGWRLVADPGLEWHFLKGDLWEASISMLIPAALFWAARGDLKGLRRRASAAYDVAETTAISILGYTACAYLMRGFEQVGGESIHAPLGAMAATMTIMAFAQAELVRRGAGLKLLRWGLTAMFGLIGFGLLGAAMTFGSPLVGWGDGAGWPVFNTMLPGYLLPAIVLVLAGRRLGWRILSWVGYAVTAYWATLTIRQAIRGWGDMVATSGISSGEMVAYTIALIVVGAVLFWQGLAKGSAGMRRLGSVAIGLTVAKVFLFDAAALGGLYRVGAFLALGMSLVALTWLDRWAAGAASKSEGPED